jgi:Mobilization protein NikA
VEEFSMQPGPNPENIDAILSRFQAWAEKHPADANGNGHKNGAASEEIREIPYDEAIRQHRSRQAAQTTRPTPSSGARKTAPSPPKSVAKPAPNPSAAEPLPAWASQLPVVPDTEPVIALNATPPAPQLPDLPADPATSVPASAPLAAFNPAPTAARRARKSSPAARPSPAKAPKLEASNPPSFPALPAQAFVDLPPTSFMTRRKSQRRTLSHPPQSRRTAAAAEAAPPHPPQRKTTPAPQPPPPKAAAIAARPPIQPARTSALIGSPIKTSPTLSLRATAARKTTAPPAPQPRTPNHPPFRKVLATTVQHPKVQPAPRKKAEPDRTRRITTRFSPSEERRIEKWAAELGVTVSAYLRQCALATLAAQNNAEPKPVLGKKKTRKAPPQPSWQPRPYAASAPSLFGGWLSLLRNRFLGPPIRFSEDA